MEAVTDLHSGTAFLHKGIKSCTNRKPATQNSLLKKKKQMAIQRRNSWREKQ